jgi:hypothetical protein
LQRLMWSRNDIGQAIAGKAACRKAPGSRFPGVA